MTFKNIFRLVPRKNGRVLSYNPLKLFPLLADSYRLGKQYGTELKLNEGDYAPDFELPDVYGATRQLHALLNHGKVVLIFYRGGWCPFCNLQLRQYQNAVPEFNEYHAKIVAVSPEVPDRAITEEEKAGLRITVLSDTGNIVARKFTGILKYEGQSAHRLKALGIDLNEINQSDSGEVPIPSVFVIDENRKIIFAKSEGGDYKKRVSPAEVLGILKQHQG